MKRNKFRLDIIEDEVALHRDAIKHTVEMFKLQQDQNRILRNWSLTALGLSIGAIVLSITTILMVGGL